MSKVYNAAFVCSVLLAVFGNIGKVEGQGEIFDVFSGALNGMVESTAGFFQNMANASDSIKNTSEFKTFSDPMKEYFETMVNATQWKEADVKEFLEFIKSWKPSGTSSTTIKPTTQSINLTEVVEYQAEEESQIVEV